MNQVLIVDTDLLTCKEIKYSLQDDSTDVYYTQSVEEAIHKMQKENYSLVIMDACLSLNGGTALNEQIRQMNPMPILALSETASTADKVMALKCGADDVLNKPYNLEECLARAQALMRRYTQLNHITGRSYGPCQPRRLDAGYRAETGFQYRRTAGTKWHCIRKGGAVIWQESAGLGKKRFP